MIASDCLHEPSESPCPYSAGVYCLSWLCRRGCGQQPLRRRGPQREVSVAGRHGFGSAIPGGRPSAHGRAQGSLHSSLGPRDLHGTGKELLKTRIASCRRSSTLMPRVRLTSFLRQPVMRLCGRSRLPKTSSGSCWDGEGYSRGVSRLMVA